MSAEVKNPEGWYFYSTRNEVAYWNGDAWTGDVGPSRSPSTVEHFHHGFLPFLRHRWFWIAVLGQIITIAVAVISKSGSPWINLLSIVGYGVFMAGSVMIVARHLHFGQLSHLKMAIWLGIISGVVAFAVGFVVEIAAGNMWGQNAVLWLAGPIEESAKLLLPFILLCIGRPQALRNPREGFLTVLVSAAVFGVIEGAEYQLFTALSVPHSWYPLVLGIGRPMTEIAHTFMTGIAAAVIWLAAFHRKRVLTLAGFVGWAAAAGIHSLHDGMTTLGQSGGQTQGLPSTPIPLEMAIVGGIVLTVISLIYAAIVYLMLRHSARELVPPQGVALNSDHWRPQIKHWGIHKKVLAPEPDLSGSTS